MGQMKIAVHFHCYYTEMLDVCLAYLRNLAAYDYDLYVTLTREDPSACAKLRSFNPCVRIAVLPNCGYDVGPFVWFLQQLPLDHYDLVLKVHTKRMDPGEAILLAGRLCAPEKWAPLLWNALLGSPEIVEKNISAFQSQPTLGMVGSTYCIARGRVTTHLPWSVFTDEMARMGYSMPVNFRFVAGTMFFVRSALLAPIAKTYSLLMFDPSSAAVRDGSLAHVLERIFGCLVTRARYEIRGFDSDQAFVFKNLLMQILRFIFRRKETKNNRVLIKIFKIPVAAFKRKHQIY